MVRSWLFHWMSVAVTAMPLPGTGTWTFGRMATRTGGPDDNDGDDDLRVLMPILGVVVVLAVVFGD